MTAKPLILKVEAKTREAQDIYSFVLSDSKGDRLPSFSAGSHLDVHIGAQVIRQYSLISGSGDNDYYQIAVLRESGGRGGSRALCDTVRTGDSLQVSEPRNHFRLSKHASRSLLLAGGIGITPIISMAETLARQGAVFELHYCARSRAKMAFSDRLVSSAYGDRVALHFGDGASDQRFDALKVVGDYQPQKHLYVCGPSGFTASVIAAAKSKGWRDDSIHFELFSGAPNNLNGGDVSFQIKIASTGRVYTVLEDQSVVQVLEAAAGIRVPVSCGQGVCGTCLIPVLDGEPDHRDLVLTPAEKHRNNQFTPCCSRSFSKVLTLDL
jgi:vanillate monooxygenase ferredoxin subunit